MSLADSLRHASGAVRLRARWVLPIHLPPIEDGEVVIEEGRILHVGKASGPADIDLGFSALLPGLVNVHAHLEYTLLRGLLEDQAFFPWVRALTALKAHLSLEDWIVSATLGAAEMLSAGITTVADASDSGASVTALIAAGMRGTVYREVFGIEAEPSAEAIVATLRRRLGEMHTQLLRAGADERIHVGISPHAPYTVRPELFTALAALARSEGLSQTIHLAESPTEMALFRGEGEFAQMFVRRGIAFPVRTTSPVAHVAAAGGLDAPTLAVHLVHSTPEDDLLLRAKKVSVAHCPRSNGKLAAGFAPLARWRSSGLTVGLGTDSLVSGNAVDFFEEMRFALYNARARECDARALTTRQALYLATLGGAEALGKEREVGSLQAGKYADLCIVRLDGLHLQPAGDDRIEAALVCGARASDIGLTLVGGRVVYEGGRFPLLDLGRLRAAGMAVRTRLCREGTQILGTS